MKILILDDSSEKIGAITKLIQTVGDNSSIVVDYSLDLSRGREKLRATFYDLLILDLNIPECIGDAPSFRAGAEFLDEIIDTNKIRKPTDIIILTAFDESVAAFREKVEHAGFFILQYNNVETAWRESLKSRIEYLLCCRRQWEITPRLPSCDVAIITAIPIETASILSMGYSWEALQVENDPARYKKATVGNPSPISLIHVQLPEMGMAAAASLTTKVITKFHPRFVVMTGIAAGIDSHLNLGDILVATDIWNYSSGKYKDVAAPDGTSIVDLLPDSKHIPLDEAIREKITSQDYREVLHQIYNSFIGAKNNTELKVHFGPIACGAAVVSSDRIVVDQVLAHSRKTIGLDMESYGVCVAAQSTSTAKTIPIIIKSVSDKGDKAKSDDYQEYASFTSIQFAKHLIEAVLFTDY